MGYKTTQCSKYDIPVIEKLEISSAEFAWTKKTIKGFLDAEGNHSVWTTSPTGRKAGWGLFIIDEDSNLQFGRFTWKDQPFVGDLIEAMQSMVEAVSYSPLPDKPKIIVDLPAWECYESPTQRFVAMKEVGFKATVINERDVYAYGRWWDSYRMELDNG
jgi:hypothetical protein